MKRLVTVLSGAELLEQLDTVPMVAADSAD